MYLSRRYCHVSEFVVLGITALYVAMKNEEIDLSPCKKFAQYVGGSCSPL